MSIAQTYFLAHKARAKLSSEAARPDHNLRLLVGHANLLDSLMLDLADAEREQESWFNQSVRGATQSPPPSTNNRHIQWADHMEEPQHDWRAEDADSDSDDSDCSYDSDEDDLDSDEDVEMADAVVALRRIPSHASMLPPKGYNYRDEEEDYDMEDDDEDYTQLALQRTSSHSAPSSPPELLDDSDSTTDDESSMPPSPPTTTLPAFDDKKSTTIQSATGHGDKDAFYEEGFYLPPRNPARISIY